MMKPPHGGKLSRPNSGEGRGGSHLGSPLSCAVVGALARLRYH